MRIENGKIMFEVVECWDCKGSGKSARYAPCVNNGKKMKGRACIYCGSRNKYDHKHSTTPHYVTCTTCGGKGQRQEDRFDRITFEMMTWMLSNLNFIFKGNLPQDVDLDMKFISDCYSGHNSFAGAQDYIDHRRDNAETILALVKKDANKWHLLQALNYIDKENNLITDIVYYGYRGGYEAEFVRKEIKKDGPELTCGIKA